MNILFWIIIGALIGGMSAVLDDFSWKKNLNDHLSFGIFGALLGGTLGSMALDQNFFTNFSFVSTSIAMTFSGTILYIHRLSKKL